MGTAGATEETTGMFTSHTTTTEKAVTGGSAASTGVGVTHAHEYSKSGCKRTTQTDPNGVGSTTGEDRRAVGSPKTLREQIPEAHSWA